MDKTDQPENSSLQHAEFAKMAKQFENVSSSHNRSPDAVSYTHLRAHETVLDLVCRLLLEKKKQSQ